MSLQFRRITDDAKDVYRILQDHRRRIGTIEWHYGVKRFIGCVGAEVVTLSELQLIVAALERLMKPINDYQVGDVVILQMTCMITKFGAKCVSTKQDPTEGTPEHDHPRFEIVENDVFDEELSSYIGKILKPGDYIIMEDQASGAILMTDAEKLAKVRKWAEGMVNCSHQLCSMAESSYEERFGQEALDILDGKKLWYEKSEPTTNSGENK